MAKPELKSSCAVDMSPGGWECIDDDNRFKSFCWGAL